MALTNGRTYATTTTSEAPQAAMTIEEIAIIKEDNTVVTMSISNNGKPPGNNGYQGSNPGAKESAILVVETTMKDDQKTKMSIANWKPKVDDFENGAIIKESVDEDEQVSTNINTKSIYTNYIYY